jgi:regulator of sigma E protease
MITLLAAIFVLGVLIFVHETGHFLTAKLFGIRVDRFSLGYPPRMVGKKIGETDYCISWIPFGGYVKIAGMVDESLDKKELSEEPKPWEFRSKPWGQKAAVILAGSLMNILFAFVIFVVATLVYGVAEQVPGSTYVGSIVEGMPAERAGLEPGDKIITIEGKPVHTWDEMTKIIRGAAERPITIEWLRHDSLFTAELTPVLVKIDEMGQTLEVGQIGVGSQGEIRLRRVGILGAVGSSGETMYSISKLVLVSIYRLITREASIRSVGGPVLIAKMAGESARYGLGVLIGFMALLSLNLGILNLLPIPVLDGGHLVFLGIEGIIRRPIPLKLKLIIQQVGMFLILGLMIFVIYNDVLRIIQK